MYKLQMNKSTHLRNDIWTGWFRRCEPGKERIWGFPLPWFFFGNCGAEKILAWLPFDGCHNLTWLLSSQVELFDYGLIFKVRVGLKLEDDLEAIFDVIKFLNKEILQELQDLLLIISEQVGQLRMIQKLCIKNKL